MWHHGSRPSPGADDEDRPAFEVAIKKAGLWDRLVALNWQRLRSLWLDEESLPPAARKRLAPFIEEAVERRARLKTGGVGEE